MYKNPIFNLKTKPYAFANIKGSINFPNISGIARFYKVREGVLVSIKISGLPTNDVSCKKPIFAVHIHSGKSCTGTSTDPFSDALVHYNPEDCAHPYHAGDLPPIFSVDGLGFSAFLTDRFYAEKIIGKTIIIHSSQDDFTTQPSGNSGAKIACGVITSVY